MKFTIRLHNGSRVHDRQVELRSPGDRRAKHGHLSFHLDGEPGEADWADIGAGVYSILIGGNSYEVHAINRRDHPARNPQQSTSSVSVGTQNYLIEVLDPRRRARRGPAETPGGQQDILAPMPGKIAKILVAENQEVEQEQGLLVIEAMKMQNELRAPRPGRVQKIYVHEGTGVESGSVLLRLA